MKKYKIQKVMVTSIDMWRRQLITKEAMEKFRKGEERTYFGEAIKDSVNDDLESLFEDLRLGKEPDELVDTYFLPKLTEKEMELVERKDSTYLQTFQRSWKIDVGEAEMKLSESDSKFLQGVGRRRTFTMEILSENILNRCYFQ